MSYSCVLNTGSFIVRALQDRHQTNGKIPMTLSETRFKALAAELSSSIAKLKGDVSPKVVHRLRTTTRRMESFVDYVHPKLTRKQTNAIEDLSALRRRAGKVRDLDIQMELLKQGIGNGSAMLDRRNFARFLQEKRTRQAKRLVSAARKIERSRLFTHLERIEQQALQHPDSFGTAATPLRHAETELTQLSAQILSPGKLKPRRLHGMRTRMKLIRYQAELAAESDEQAQFVRKMKSVQDAVGEWHDWQALCTVAEKFFKDRANCPLLVEARALNASKYMAATSAVTSLLESQNPARKRPSTVHLVAANARRA
jgi:CHAD domain-containing protein